MTYLQLVNKVLVRLRENEVSTVGENSYSKLIGEYVNDAKRTVENAWDWTGLRNTLTVDTQANVFNYVLTGADNTIKILDVLLKISTKSSDSASEPLTQQVRLWPCYLCCQEVCLLRSLFMRPDKWTRLYIHT